MIYLLIIVGVPLATVAWWVLSHIVLWRTWGTPRGRGTIGTREQTGSAVAADPSASRWPYRLLQAAVAGFFGFLITMFCWIVIERFGGISDPPLWGRTTAFVWSVAAFPATLVIVITAAAWTVIERLAGSRRAGLKRWADRAEATPAALPGTGGDPAGASAEPMLDLEGAGVSRRTFLAASVLAAPPLLTAGFTIKSGFDHGNFRTRELTVPIAHLPIELEGLTIAHVSDVHIGRYTDGPMLRRIVDATNNLRCDLIAMTGDLIDFAIEDVAEAVAMVRSMDAPGGVVLCEGNHDLFVSPLGFRNTIKKAGVDLLINEAIIRKLRGIECEISGLRWGWTGPQTRMSAYEQNFALLEPALREQGSGSGKANLGSAFGPALRLHLAHHPHAFDLAAEDGVDLTLCGHTHGGQLMITERFGPANMVFKYISGLYARRNTAGKLVSCVVSNGTGNWLPLRMSAPAEIARLTLVRA